MAVSPRRAGDFCELAGLTDYGELSIFLLSALFRAKATSQGLMALRRLRLVLML